MAPQVEIEFTAKDKTGGVLSGLKSKLGDIFTMASGFLAAQVFQRIGQEVVSFARDSISAASDLNETLSKTHEIFGASSEDIVMWAERSATAVGLNQAAALDAASMFAVFGKSAGLAGTDLNDFATENLTLAADLASFFNTSVEEASTAMQAAFRGETEPIRKYGILLDDASLRAKALELGIVSTTKNALTPQQKVLAAQALIFAQTADAQGDFERTSGGLANQQRILAAQIDNAKASLGMAFLPIVTKVVGFLNTQGIPALQNVINIFKNIVGAFSKGFDANAQFGPVVAIIQGIQDALFELGFDNLAEGMNTVFDIFAKFKEGDGIGGIFEKLQTVFQTLMPIISGVGGVLFQSLWPAIVQIAQALAPLIQEFLPQIVQLFSGLATELVGRLLPPFMQLVSAVLPIVAQLFTTVIGAIMPLLDAILPPLTDLILMLIEAILPLIEELLPPFATLFTTLIAAIAPLLATILPVLVQLFGVILELLIPIIELIATGLIIQMDALSKIIETYVIPAIQKFSDWIDNKVVPAINGIRDAIAPVIDWVRNLADSLSNITLPDWMTPGSPTPLELGLRGISSAMGQLDSIAGGMSLSPVLAGTAAGAGTAPATSYNSSAYSQSGGINTKELAREIVTAFLRAQGQ